MVTDKIAVNRIGKITNGDMKNWYIKVLDDTENTGGYLFIESPNIDFRGEGYDNWFLDLKDVLPHIEHCKYQIEWI